MSDPQPNIKIPVDLTNPGQFFACCGLLELADRLWPRAEVVARFEARRFVVMANESTCSLGKLVSEFVKAQVDQLDPTDNAASALHLSAPFNLRLDWWCKLETDKKIQIDLGGGEQLKPWAGKQFGPLIFRLMKQYSAQAALDSPLDYAAAVFDSKGEKAKKKTVSPFYFDSRREGTSLDLGFSPDEQDMSVLAFPVVESLALVGLQRFRPSVDESSQPRAFVYTPWEISLPAMIAAVAVSGRVAVQSSGSFRFTKPSRGGEYMTMFSRARRERSNHV
jgi:hypothetical protein